MKSKFIGLVGIILAFSSIRADDITIYGKSIDRAKKQLSVNSYQLLDSRGERPFAPTPTTPACQSASGGEAAGRDYRSPITKGAWADTFSSYVYTFDDLVLFSYMDNTELEVYNDVFSLIWSGTLNNEQYTVLHPGDGVYFVQGSKKYAVLVGDPVSQSVVGYYAVDEESKPLSTRLLTYMPEQSWGPEQFIVFAYENGTSVTIKNMDTGTLLWSGSLNQGEHYSFYPGKIPIIVTGSAPVSALSYGDQGYYVPSAEGLFTGTLFYTWVGYIGSWQEDLNIIGWHDNTNIQVKNTDTGALISSATINEGEVKNVQVINTYVTIESDMEVSCAVTPFKAYVANYAHFIRGIDISSGMGIGQLFYICGISGTASRLDVLAYKANTQVDIINQYTGATVWTGTLNTGGHYTLSPVSNIVYKIVSTEAVSVFESCAGGFGADFAPLWYASPAEIEETSNAQLTINNYQLSIYPNPFTAGVRVQWSGISEKQEVSLKIYDLTGRLVKTLIPNPLSLTTAVYWDASEEKSGIYFLRIKVGDKSVNKKIIHL